MISARTKGLLDRVRNHPLAPVLKASMADALSAGERFSARKAELAKAGTLTTLGQRQALQDALTAEFGKAYARAKDPVAKARKETKARRAALVVKAVDPSNIAAALERQEVRAWFRSLDLMARQTVALTTKDKRILDALCTAPPELSGFTELPEHVAQQVEARYLELTYGPEVAAIEEAEAVIAEAEAAIQIARNDLQNVADLHERDFETIMDPIERGVGRPWLLKRGDDVQVAEVLPDGTASYHHASPDEIAAGVYYKDYDEYKSVQGMAA